MQSLPLVLAGAARGVAEALRAAGHRAWLVGGAVRDLALEVEPKDADLASAATPDELEDLFPTTHAVGRAFGTVVVRSAGIDVQVTTFRAESAYDDARRPSSVRFGATLEEDAARRDFTCNSLYLDPLTDELADPTGGLADLAARRLRCVGDAAARFTEDGLRLLRLARLAAEHDLAVEADTLAGARAALEALRGVSPERVLAELTRMAEGRAPARAVRLLDEIGVLERLPGLRSVAGGTPLRARVEALARLEGRGERRFFAVLLRPGPGEDPRPAADALAELRPSRALLLGVQRVWELERELAACLAALGRAGEKRARWVRVVRAPEFADALAVCVAWRPAEFVRERAELARRVAPLAHDELWPAPLVTSAELAQAEIPRGPRWSELLRAAEDAQLEGELCTPDEVRAWLAQRARE